MNLNERTDLTADNETRPFDILFHAQKLNSGLGRHGRSSNFTKGLNKRFYKDNSMEALEAKKVQIRRMKEKERELQDTLTIEDRRIQKLEDLLVKIENEYFLETARQDMKLSSAIRVQTWFRKISAMKFIALLKVERDIKMHIAIFVQKIFRGQKGRQLAIEFGIRQRREECAAIHIQCMIRCYLAIHWMNRKKQKIKTILLAKLATNIQAFHRGRQGRAIAKKKKNEQAKICRAACFIQHWFIQQKQIRAAKKIQASWLQFSLAKKKHRKKNKPQRVFNETKKNNKYNSKIRNAPNHPPRKERNLVDIVCEPEDDSFDLLFGGTRARLNRHKAAIEMLYLEKKSKNRVNTDYKGPNHLEKERSMILWGLRN